MSGEEFSEISNQYDEDGNMQYDIRKNNESNGKFHTDWLNMIYPRLKLAKDLLSEDGVIFISIDDNEVDNLKKICNEIFGEINFVEELIWKRRANTPNDRYVGKIHEYILMYSKNYDKLTLYLQPRDKEIDKKYKNPNNDSRGPWFPDNLSANGKGGRLVEGCVFPINNPHNGKEYMPPQNKCWLYNKEKIEKLLNDDRIGFRESSGTPYLKRFLSEVRQGSTLPTLLLDKGFSVDSAKEIKSLFNKDIFEFPKPIKLLKTLIKTGSNDKNIILDFFSGSSTTAHAVMQLNAEEGENRKFIMVQIPEVTDEKSDAFKDGYKNICEIGKERIRRAGKKIKEENQEKSDNLDIGFRVLKVDSSNMKDMFYSPKEYTQQVLEKVISNIKDDRSSEDLLFQVILDLGELLSSDIEELNIEGNKVFNVGQGNIVVCFDNDVTNEVVIEIAKMQPLYAVFRDSSLSSDSVATNFEQIFKTYSPGTRRKVL